MTPIKEIPIALLVSSLAARRRLRESLTAAMLKPRLTDIRAVGMLETSFELGQHPVICFVSSAIGSTEITKVIDLCKPLPFEKRPKLVVTLPAQFQGISALVTELYLKGVDGFIAEPFSSVEIGKLVDLMLEPTPPDDGARVERAAALLVKEIQKYIDQLAAAVAAEEGQASFFRKEAARLSSLLRPLAERDTASFGLLLAKLFDAIPAPATPLVKSGKKHKKAERQHPGKVAQELLQQHGSSMEWLAGLLQLNIPTTESFLAGKHDVDKPLAQKLSIALGKTPTEWLRIQTQWTESNGGRSTRFDK